MCVCFVQCCLECSAPCLCLLVFCVCCCLLCVGQFVGVGVACVVGCCSYLVGSVLFCVRVLVCVVRVFRIVGAARVLVIDVLGLFSCG